MWFAGTWPKTGSVKKGKLKEEKIKILDKTDAKKYAFALNTFNKDVFFDIKTLIIFNFLRLQ